MSPKMTFGLLLRLAVLLAAFLIQPSEGAVHEGFVYYHIDFPKTPAPNDNSYCNIMMKRKGLTERSCPATHVFINGWAISIQGTCRGGGIRVSRDNNLYDSRHPYPVVTCQNRGRHPNCHYVGKGETKRFRVGCRGRLAYRFERLIND